MGRIRLQTEPAFGAGHPNVGNHVSRMSVSRPADREAPRVSICIPTFNGAAWIAETLASCLGQDFTDLEVVVCDGGSSDDTVAIALGHGDSRVRVVEADADGMAANWNRSIQVSRGSYIKPLGQDDLLEPQCLSRMVAVLEAEPSLGFVFAPRHVRLDGVPEADAADWLARFASIHQPLGPLSTVNDGRLLFELVRRDRFRRNWFGEPSSLMIRRQVLACVGLFNVELRQLTDLEMCLRLAFHFRVGFLPEPLSTFRVHGRSASSGNQKTGAAWLDGLWLLEGLSADPDIRPELSIQADPQLWLLALAGAIRRFSGASSRMGPRRAELLRYLRFRLARGTRRRLHPQLATGAGWPEMHAS